MAIINVNIPIEDAVTDGSLNPVTSNAVFDALADKANTADLATVATTGDYNDLNNLPTIPAAQVNADWNATSGVAEILNKPTIPSIAGLVPDTRNLTINGTTYDLSADRSWVIAATASTLQHEVKAGEVMTKGQAVYVSSADGTNMIVSLASNATEATSSKTMGLIIQNLANNGKGYVITEGLLAGLNTSSATAGDPVWLGTGGNLIYGLINKPAAPAHLVFIGIVTRANSSNGEIFVRVQNGFELQELHNVSISSVADNNILQYDSATSLWKNESLSTAGIQPTLVSATNIKTINSTSLLGSGNIAISTGLTIGTTPITSGTVGRILFQGTGDVTQQDSTLFWDNTNKRLGVGATPSTSVRLDVRAQGALSTDIAFRVRNSADTNNIMAIQADGVLKFGEAFTDFITLKTSYFNNGPSYISIKKYAGDHTYLGTDKSWTRGFLALGHTAPVYYVDAIGGDRYQDAARIGTNHNPFSYANQETSTSFLFTTGKQGGLWAGDPAVKLTAYTYNINGNTGDKSTFIIGMNKNGINAQRAAITCQSNLLLQAPIENTNDIGVIYVPNGNAPTASITDGFKQYSADIVAGNAAPHFRTENGDVIKLYRQSSTGITTVADLVTVLTNLGLLS